MEISRSTPTTLGQIPDIRFSSDNLPGTGLDYEYEKAHLKSTYSSHIQEFFLLNLGLARGQIVNKMICEQPEQDSKNKK